MPSTERLLSHHVWPGGPTPVGESPARNNDPTLSGASIPIAAAHRAAAFERRGEHPLAALLL